MSNETFSWKSRNFQFTFKKKEKFFNTIVKLKYEKVSIQKKKNILIGFFLKIIQKFLMIGSVISITTERVIIVGLYPHTNWFSLKHFFLYKNTIYGKNLSLINLKNCVSLGDIVIAKIDQSNQEILTTFHANLGVLLSIGYNNQFLLPISNYEMLCCNSKKKNLKKLADSAYGKNYRDRFF